MAEKEKKDMSEKEIKDKKKEILKNSRVKDPYGWPIEYVIEINSPFDKPEKFYNLLLTSVKGSFKGKVIKVDLDLNASPTSAFFGDISQRRAYAKENIDKASGHINNIVQTVVKLLYSLKEFDSILDIFKKLESSDKLDVFAGEQNLRRIFLDEIDRKKGRGAMWEMRSQLEYVSIVDSFLTIESLKDIDDLRTNEDLKRILKGRFQEYEIWKNAYKKDISSRKEIQKQYLKSEVEMLKLQLDWVKPHYTVLKQLEIGSGTTDPDLLVGFDTSFIKTKIRCIKGGEEEDSLLTAFLDLDFAFKTGPYPVQSDSGGRSFHHRFGTKITFTPYVMSNEDYKDFLKAETMNDIDFFKDIVGSQLKAMTEDLDKYLEGQDYVGKEKPKDDSDSKALTQFEFLILPFKSIFSMFGIDLSKKEKGKPKYSVFKYQNDKEELIDFIKDKTKGAYNTFKDETGLPTESATLSLHK